MAKAKVIICADEEMAKAFAANLKTPSGGGYTTVDGPIETDFVVLETFGVQPKINLSIGDVVDLKTWLVVAKKA
jgi:hypothetical protein